MSAPTSAQWLRAAAARIATGSQILARERTARLVKWVRSVWRRTMSWLGDASGIAWAFRLAVLLAAAWVLRKIVLGVAGAVARRLEATPSLMWIALALWLIAAWRVGNPKRPAAGAAAEEPEPEEEPTVLDIVALLRDLSEQGKRNVFLTHLQKAAGLPDTKTVRALLDEAGVRVREGVRVGLRTDRGVHRDDIPTPPPAPGTPSGTPVDAGQGANTNTNSGTGEGPGEGLRVVHSDYGATIYDPADITRKHTVAR